MTPFILLVLLYAPVNQRLASVMEQVHSQEFADEAACRRAAHFIEVQVKVNQLVLTSCLPKSTPVSAVPAN